MRVQDKRCAKPRSCPAVDEKSYGHALHPNVVNLVDESSFELGLRLGLMLGLGFKLGLSKRLGC